MTYLLRVVKWFHEHELKALVAFLLAYTLLVLLAIFLFDNPKQPRPAEPVTGVYRIVNGKKVPCVHVSKFVWNC